ncbi:putative protein C11orf86 [Galemys pyrenaicus]|uniref:Uncharacterized protein n=1 Tax=Galemys pyrenaicus TaxID=202257 RepID=A0A8J6DWR5_GALPY|nr:putative protein C11orf86 [Galemys pyrenaicus]
MGTGPCSQSLRVPRPSYGKLQEAAGGRLRRSLSLRQEKSRSPEGGPDGPDAPGPETQRDTEQLIRAQRGGSRQWLRQHGQVEQHPAVGLATSPPASVLQQVRRRWERFVSHIPSVTLSWPASPEPPLSTTC